MRNTFAREILRLAKERKDIVLLSGDIGNRMFDKFKEYDFNRFLNCGIAEANMMSIASGMALSGLRPIIYTITPFTTSRCFEQIKIGAAYHNANIVIVGTGSGLSYSELGPTHHSLEDIGILSTLPGIRILAPCDSIELSSQLEECISLEGPTYIRIGKKGEPILTSTQTIPRIGRSNILKEGDDVLLLGIGPILNEALKASEKLKILHNRDLCVVSMGGVEPIDEDFLSSMLCRKYNCWITLEEHGMVGGLGSKINNWLNKKNISRNFDVINIHTPNEFIHNLGNQSFVRKNLGLDSNGILQKIIPYV